MSKVDEDLPWIEKLNIIRVWVAAHDGQFPTNKCPDRQTRAMVKWWKQEQASHRRGDQSPNRGAAIDDTRDLARDLAENLSWEANLRALHDHIIDYDGRFPSALRGWWQTQKNALRQGLQPTNRALKMTELIDYADTLRNQATAERKELVRQSVAVTRTAATRKERRRQVKCAQKMLTSRYLLPGDQEVLQLRVDHPDLSLKDLAKLSGTNSFHAFKGRLYHALSRGPNQLTERREREQWEREQRVAAGVRALQRQAERRREPLFLPAEDDDSQVGGSTVDPQL